MDLNKLNSVTTPESRGARPDGHRDDRLSSADADTSGDAPTDDPAAGANQDLSDLNAQWDISPVDHGPSTAGTTTVRILAGHLDQQWGSACGFIATTILTIALMLSAIAGSGEWSAGLALMLATIGALTFQTRRLELTRTALACSYLDRSYTGGLCESLEAVDRRVRDTAALLLTELLPRLLAGDEALLTTEQKGCLYRRLAGRRARFNPALTVAILRALPHIGSESALPHVQRLAGTFAVTAAGRRIAHAARSVLPLLEERLARRRAEEAARLAAIAQTNAAREAALPESERQRRARHAAEIDAQLREIEEDLRKLPKPGMRLGFLLASWCIIVPYAAFQTYAQFASRQWLLGTLCAILTALATQLHRLTVSERHKAFAQRMSRVTDVRFIGRLADLLEWPDPEVQAAAVGALTRLLPAVKASDTVFHSAGQRAALYGQLVPAKAGRHSEFLIAILRALEQVGDAAAVPHVLHLANAQPVSARERRVCDAASECLPYLQERARLSDSSNMLLRASSAAWTGADTLVRAADATPASDPGELLRAGSGDGANGS